jgi:hypothetical protein
MSARYEFGRATETPTEVVHPDDYREVFGDEPDNATDYVLVIGDPWASAYAVEGSREELQAFTARLAGLVASLPEQSARAAAGQPPYVPPPPLVADTTPYPHAAPPESLTPEQQLTLEGELTRLLRVYGPYRIGRALAAL